MADFVALLESEEGQLAPSPLGANPPASETSGAERIAPVASGIARPKIALAYRMLYAKMRKKMILRERLFEGMARQLRPKNKVMKFNIHKRKDWLQAKYILSKAGKPTGEKACEPSAYMAVAFATPACSEHAALQLGVARKTVTRMRYIVAQFILEHQLRLLEGLAELAAAQGADICITREAWDETSQACVFRTDAADRSSECKSLWSVMVLRVSVCIAWSGGRHMPIFYECIVPPMVLPSTSAANMYYCLRNHPSYMEFWQRLQALRSKCVWRGCLLESDAAYANEKLVAFFLQAAPAAGNTLLAWKACHSHKNMHVENMVLSAVDVKLIGKIYSMCAFLRSGTHWFRLKRALTEWSAEASRDRVVYGQPTELSRRFAESIVSYYRATAMPIQQRSSARSQRWRHGVGSLKMEADAARRANQRHQEFIRSLEAFLRDRYNCLDSSGMVHICGGPMCCPGGPEVLAQELATGLRELVLRRVPAPPVASKWTKLAPALNALVFGIFLRLWPTLFAQAFGARSSGRYHTAEHGTHDEDDAQGGLDFHALSGRRHGRTVDFVTDRSSSIGMIILVLCLEPVRRLTEFFIKCSSDTRPPGCPPFLMTLLSPQESPLTMVMQYLANLYFGPLDRDSRLWLFLGWLGFGSLDDCFRGCGRATEGSPLGVWVGATWHGLPQRPQVGQTRRSRGSGSGEHRPAIDVRSDEHEERPGSKRMVGRAIGGGVLLLQSAGSRLVGRVAGGGGGGREATWSPGGDCASACAPPWPSSGGSMSMSWTSSLGSWPPSRTTDCLHNSRSPSLRSLPLRIHVVCHLGSLVLCGSRKLMC